MKLALQRDCYGSLQFESDVCWRDSASNLADSVIGGALRSPECTVDTWQRLLGDAALQDLEQDVYTGIQLQVRTMRLFRFPANGAPILLDWRRAWTRSDWTDWEALIAALPSGVTKTDLLAKQSAIDSCFETADDAPLQITYVDCNGDTTVLDNTTYTLRNSSSGDRIARVNDCCWPTVCRTCERNHVEIKYVVGYGDPDTFRNEQPNMLANIAAMFNYRFENPEIMGGNSSKTYELLTQYFRKNLSWRI